MRKILFFVSHLFIIGSAYCQDIHLTQYYTSNQYLNPAYTGNFSGDLRVVLNYRNQWKQLNNPITTGMVSLENKTIVRTGEVGLGIILINDHISPLHLKTNKAFLSGSYQKDINNNLFRVGLQAGIVYHSLDMSDQLFPDQWDYASGTFDPSVYSGEAAMRNYSTYVAINTGVSWSRKFNKMRVSAGYGLFNLNRPKNGFIIAESLPFNHVFNSSVAIQMTSRIVLTPHLLYKRTAHATDFILGGRSTYSLAKNFGVLLGAGFRGSTLNSDSFIGTAGLGIKRVEIGFSVDMNVSGLSKATASKSAWEISLIYTTPGRHASKVTIPCDRY